MSNKKCLTLYLLLHGTLLSFFDSVIQFCHLYMCSLLNGININCLIVLITDVQHVLVQQLTSDVYHKCFYRYLSIEYEKLFFINTNYDLVFLLMSTLLGNLHLLQQHRILQKNVKKNLEHFTVLFVTFLFSLSIIEVRSNYCQCFSIFS